MFHSNSLNVIRHTPFVYCYTHGSLTRYAKKLWVAYAPKMSGTISPPPTSKKTTSGRSWYASRHVRHAHAVMHVGIAKPCWWGKRFRHSRDMCNPQFYVSSKRRMYSSTFSGYLQHKSCLLNLQNHVPLADCYVAYENAVADISGYSDFSQYRNSLIL